MSIATIKTEICLLLNLNSISANEAKQLKQAENIKANWSLTTTWQELLNNIQSENKLQESTTAINDVSEEVTTFTINPVLSANSFIDLILANKVWLYHQYKINNIKFPSNNKAVLYSELLQDSFIVTKANNYKISFKSVTHELEETTELFRFDWLNLSNYYYELTEQKLIRNKEKKSDITEYKSVKIPNSVNKANQLLFNIANFKQQNTADKLSNNIKTFKDWCRTIYLELPESKLEDFLTGLKRNHARQSIDQVREAFKLNNKVIGKIVNHNSTAGAMNYYNEPHIDIKGRYQPKKAVMLTRIEEKTTPIVDSYLSITIAELFKLLDITVDMSQYIRYAGYCGYYKLIIISHLLNRTQYKLSNPWMVLVSSHLKMHNTLGGYVLVEEIDSKRQNNKIRLNNNTSFDVASINSGKVQSSYLEANKLKIIDRIEVNQTNYLLGTSSKCKSVKKTNKGNVNANYLKIAETNNYELRLLYLEDGSKQKPHSSFKEVLANLVYVDKSTTISNEVGQIWIKTSKKGKSILVVSGVLRDKQTLINGNYVERKILTYRKKVEQLSSQIRELRTRRQDNKIQSVNLVNERVITDSNGLAVSVVTEEAIAKELRGLINEKVKYELEIKSYDMELPHEIVLALYQLGINLLTDGIVPRSLDWSIIFSSLDLEIPVLSDNAIIVKGAKHESIT